MTDALSYFDVKYVYRPTYHLGESKYLGLSPTYNSQVFDLNIAEKSYITGDPLTQIMGEKSELLGSL